jgi:hypothetical protein
MKCQSPLATSKLMSATDRLPDVATPAVRESDELDTIAQDKLSSFTLLLMMIC